nr:tyrosine-type recombinase/integrase [uncultured Dethiosulfovibrio sp.]
MRSFGDILASFIDYLSLERGYSDNTVTAYRRDVLQWKVFCEKKEDDCFRPSEGLYDLYVMKLRREGLADSSVQRKCSSVRTWVRFLVIEGHIPDDFTLPGLPSRPKKLPQILTEGEMDRLFKSCDDDPNFYMGLRDRAIIEVLYGCGLRASELCGLSLKDIRQDPGALFVLGKGGKERMVPLVGSARRWMDKYLSHGRPLKDRSETDRVFLSIRGGPLRRESLWRIIKSRGKLAGISSARLHPHVIRHTVASHLLRRGMDLRTLQEFLGHSSIDTTEKYLHFDLELRDVYDSSHPRAKYT